MKSIRHKSSTTLKVFGVKYTHIPTPCGGDLWLTEYGLPLVNHLLPSQWHKDRYYVKHGERLSGSTGTVYRVTPKNADSRCQIVAKFSRVGQEVPLVIDPDFPDDIKEIDIAGARFNSPWEEFGLVMELRRGGYGDTDPTLYLQRPLGIFAPKEEFDIWRLGRSNSRFGRQASRLQRDQARYPLAVEMDIKRNYIVLYGWIKGINAVMAQTKGMLTESELFELTKSVVDDLKAKGFRVLDNKPDHFIVRSDPRTGELVKRNGRLVYALVDFELLQRTVTAQQTFRDRQRDRYFHALAGQIAPSHDVTGAEHTNIMGVDYIFGRSPNGGMLWVIGDNAELFGYFQPDRWRRTPRVKLSLGSEVYRTVTRDDIHIVYRLSRVGQRPQSDPFFGHGKRTRAYGHNSPFEEFAIVEKLRQTGFPTVYPRAIYRTAHQTSRAHYLHDPSRYRSHAELLTPGEDPQLILDDRYDYYTLWGQWRGIDPMWHIQPSGHWGFIDAERVRVHGLLTPHDVNLAIASSREQLVGAGCDELILDDHQFLFIFDDQGKLRRDKHDKYEIALAFDALTALNYGLINEDTYRDLVEDVAGRLRDAGYEALTLSGSHLLLSFDTYGNLRTNDRGGYETALCSFDLVAPLDQSDQ